MGLNAKLKRLEREACGDLESFELLDSTRYYFDPLETYAERYLHALDVQLGDGHKWPEPPEIYRKMVEAKDLAAVLEQLRPVNSQVSLMNVEDVFEIDAIVNERRLVTLTYESPEDLSE